VAYKAEEAGSKFIKVNPNNTSQNCSNCGEKVPKTLSERTHDCITCGLVLDRDHNAAINILRLGASLVGLTCSIGKSVLTEKTSTQASIDKSSRKKRILGRCLRLTSTDA
jgi:putative transposase